MAFEGPTVAPFAWQSNKAILFYFTPNCLQDLNWCWGTEARFSFTSMIDDDALEQL